jgi:hypothetical protein
VQQARHPGVPEKIRPPLIDVVGHPSLPHDLVDAHGPKPVIMEDLLDGWATETGKGEKALYDRQRTVAAFVRHLGHNDAARVAAENVVAYK